MTTPLSDDRKDHPAAGAVIIGVNLSTAVIYVMCFSPHQAFL